MLFGKKATNSLGVPYSVIVMDLCSSSVILEKLQEQGKIKKWKRFWNRVFRRAAIKPYFNARCRVYKFTGDGFIILYRNRMLSDLMEFLKKLNDFAMQNLTELLSEYNITPKRLGFTYGIDSGKLVWINLEGKSEYMGKAINVATRLQSLLKNKEDVGTVLVSEKVFAELTLPESTKTEKCSFVLRNLFDDEPFACHKIYL